MIKKISVIILTTLFLLSGFVITNEWFSGKASGASVYRRGDTVDNETWESGNVHFVDDQYNVTEGKTLTIEGGAVVRVDADGKLVIKNGGKLAINGGQGNTVLFTSNTSSPARGDYVGIVIEDGGIAYINYTNIRFAYKGVDIAGGNTELNHCRINETGDLGIEYTGTGAPRINQCIINDTGGGGSGDGGIRITSNGVVAGCHIYNSSDSGIYVAGGTPRIESTHIHDTAGNGIRISGVSAVPVIIDCNIDETGGSNIYVSGNTRTITLYNSTVTNTVQDIIEISGTSDSKLIDVVLLNSTYTNDSFTVPLYGNLTVKWYENAFVKDQAGQPISGATVNLTNRTGVVKDSKVTNARGEAYWLEATEFVYDSRGFFFDKYYDIEVDHHGFDPVSHSVWASGFNNTTFVLTDSDDPTSSVNALSPYWRDAQPITIELTAADAGTGLEDVTLWFRFSTDNASWGGWVFHGKDAAAPWSFNFDAPNGSGYYEFYSIANDTAGNEEGVPANNDTLCGHDTSAPVADAGLNRTVDQGNLLTFDGTDSTDDLGIANYTWNFTDGGVLTLYGEQPGYTFQSAGEYLVTLNVTDFPGKWSTDTMKITVNDVTQPTADAGTDRSVNQGEVVTFDGSGSSDNVGIDNYTWNFTDDGAVIRYDVTPSYRFDNAGVFKVSLNVSDEAGNWNVDIMMVTVNDTTAPLADAGNNQSVNQHDMVILDGSGSSDNVGIENFTWTFGYTGGNETLYGVGPAFIFDDAGNFTVTLNVTDAAGNWDTDTIWVMVNDTTLPDAVAGDNIFVDQHTEVTLNGSGSSDNVGIFNYMWTFVDGNIQTLTGRTPAYMFENASVFILTLNVSDAAGNWATDPLTVTVNDTDDPTARPGDDITVDQGTEVTFDGSASTDNVGVSSFTWTFRDGGENRTLNGMSPDHTFADPGIFEVTLNVTDVRGNWATDTMTVTVNDTEAPKASAGKDVTISQKEVVLFDGANSTDNLAVDRFVWTFFYYNGNVTLYGSDPYFQFTIVGRYEITLNVTDAAGNWDVDTVNVTVLDITKPIANAGPDIYLEQDETAYLNGNRSTDNVAIVNYTWKLTYNDVPYLMHGMEAEFSFGIPGQYIVNLTVKDGSGNSNFDIMFVQVNDTKKPLARPLKTQEGNKVSFNASMSTDNIEIVEYVWTFVYDGENVTLDGMVVEFIFNVPGDYNVTLNVTDAAGNQGTAYLEVSIGEGAMGDLEPPTAKAAANRHTLTRGDVVTLNGNGSTDNIGIVEYSWAFKYKGKGMALLGKVVEFRFNETGEYNITLTVTDAAGNKDSDMIVIDVLKKEVPPDNGGGGEEKGGNDGTTVIIVVLVFIVVIVIIGALIFFLRKRALKREKPRESYVPLAEEVEDLEKECPKCGAKVMVDMTYCPECGETFEMDAGVTTEELGDQEKGEVGGEKVIGGAEEKEAEGTGPEKEGEMMAEEAGTEEAGVEEDVALPADVILEDEPDVPEDLPPEHPPGEGEAEGENAPLSAGDGEVQTSGEVPPAAPEPPAAAPDDTGKETLEGESPAAQPEENSGAPEAVEEVEASAPDAVDAVVGLDMESEENEVGDPMEGDEGAETTGEEEKVEEAAEGTADESPASTAESGENTDVAEKEREEEVSPDSDELDLDAELAEMGF